MSRRSHGVRLYPPSARDRLFVWLGIAQGIMAALVLSIADDFLGYVIGAFNGLGAAIAFVLSYPLQDRPEHAESANYAQMVGQLDQTRKVLQTMSAFLERERLRMNQAEQTLRNLEDESAALEPVVRTKRETVEAILTAYASAVRAHAWKDRLMGFGVGVLSSLVAGAILYAFGVGR